MDTLEPKSRSRVMSRIKGRDTKPEMTVRRILHHLGFRYRLHSKELPGKPDIVFKSRKKVIFVHGCFWHGHDNGICRRGRRPTSRRDFWDKKLDKNMARDRNTEMVLADMGYDVLVVWQCDLKDIEGLTKRLIDYLQ